MSLIQDMYKDGDGDTRRAISQAWDKANKLTEEQQQPKGMSSSQAQAEPPQPEFEHLSESLRALSGLSPS